MKKNPMKEPAKPASPTRKGSVNKNQINVPDLPIIMEGFMKKKSSGVIKRWQNRYFALTSSNLSYYTDDKKGDVKGTLELAELQAAGRTDIMGEVQVVVAGESTMYRCESNVEADKWSEALKNIVSSRGGNPGVPPPPPSPSKSKRGSDTVGADGRARSVKRPLRLSVVSASGLKAAAGGTCNAVVIVSAVDKTHDYVQEFQLFTSHVSDSVKPAWGDSGFSGDDGKTLKSGKAKGGLKGEATLIPGLTGDVSLAFTVCHWSEEAGQEGELTFLGQAVVDMKKKDNNKLWAKPQTKSFSLKLSSASIKPQDGAGKEIEIANIKKGKGSGVLEVQLQTLAPEAAMCGDIMKTGGDLFTSVWKDRWLCLVAKQLMYYDNLGDGRPKALVDMSQVASVEHPEGILELVVLKVKGPAATREGASGQYDEAYEKGHGRAEWQFKAHDALKGAEWWYRLREAAGLSAEGKDKGVSLASTKHANKTAKGPSASVTAESEMYTSESSSGRRRVVVPSMASLKAAAGG